MTLMGKTVTCIAESGLFREPLQGWTQGCVSVEIYLVSPLLLNEKNKTDRNHWVAEGCISVTLETNRLVKLCYKRLHVSDIRSKQKPTGLLRTECDNQYVR